MKNEHSKASTSEIALLKGWVVKENKLYKNFKFSDFVSAFGFMAKVALISEKLSHHPEWSNSYNQVTIFLHTHDSNLITKLDIQLAKAINDLM